MNNQTLVIYDFKVLYNILNEIDSYINFHLIYIDKLSELNSKNLDNYLILSKNKKKNLENQIFISRLPIEIKKLDLINNLKLI